MQILESKLPLARYLPLGLHRIERIDLSCPSVTVIYFSITIDSDALICYGKHAF